MRHRFLKTLLVFLVGLSGLEPPTSRLSGVRSNRLSYKPINLGNHLLSQAVPHQVPSAVHVLTVVFGMGTGVSHGRIVTENYWVNFQLSDFHLSLKTQQYNIRKVCSLERR